MSANDPFTPPAPAPVDPDSALADLESDFEELTAPPDVVVVPQDLPPIGRSWGFDFVGGGFAIGPSRGPVGTSDLSTLIQWCEKTLRTASGSPIHPPDYGMDDPDTLIATTIDGAPISQFQQQIQKALLFHPRITDVTDFRFDYSPGDEFIRVAFTVVVDEVSAVTIDTRLAATTATTEF